MPATSAKNMLLSPATNALYGDGDALTEQLNQQDIERRKKLLQGMSKGYDPNQMSAAVSALGLAGHA